ncbi:Na+/H+ antiporter NhaA [Rhodococcus pyridinivorans]|uniref:Na+/H+ antiporter NhaA n=1 Tax=Rhodococcus pyridinivorans TaxID=103816 RepID=UPI003413F72F
MARQAPKPQGLRNQLSNSLRRESGPAVLLLVVTVIALLWANSPASGAYFDLWHQDAGFELGPVGRSPIVGPVGSRAGSYLQSISHATGWCRWVHPAAYSAGVL